MVALTACSTRPQEPPPAGPQPVPDSAPQMVRIEGSGVLGDDLVPALARAFLDRAKATDVHGPDPGPAGYTVVSGLLTGDDHPVEFMIRSTSEGAALAEPTGDRPDLVMATRPFDTIDQVAGAGTDYPIALDGVVAVVNNNSDIAQLTSDQLAAVYTCRVADWNQLGGAQGEIDAFAPDDVGDGRDVVRRVVGGDMCAKVQRLGGDSRLSGAVTGDASAIGLVSSAYVGNTTAVTVDGVTASPDTIGSGRYPFSRRLVLLASGQPSGLVSRFARFAMSDEGKAVVRDQRFVVPTPGSVPCDGPDDYCRFVMGAERLPFDIGFPFDSSALDPAATEKIGQLSRYLDATAPTGRTVLLAGFSDRVGTDSYNRALSAERAAAVATVLGEKYDRPPSRADGFGWSKPVDSSDTDEGKRRNRRVEVWLTR